MDDKLILWFDGACQPCNPGGWATFGWILERDGEQVATGRGLAAQGDGATSNTGEYAGVIDALQALLEMEAPAAEIEIRGDSQVVIRQLAGKWGCGAPLLVPLHHQARDLIRQLVTGGWDVSFRWVPREENTEADKLSHEAYEEARLQVQEGDGYAGAGDLVATPVMLQGAYKLDRARRGWGISLPSISSKGCWPSSKGLLAAGATSPAGRRTIRSLPRNQPGT